MGRMKNMARALIVRYLPLKGEPEPRVTKIEIRQLGLATGQRVIVNRG